MLDTNEHVDVYTGHGEFVSNKEIAITAGEDNIVLSGDTIIINTGAVAINLILMVSILQQVSIIVPKFNSFHLNLVH